MTARHHQTHDHPQPAFVPALAITLAFAVVELAGGLWSGSLALISDAGHMFSDALALTLAAVAVALARRPASLRHSYVIAGLILVSTLRLLRETLHVLQAACAVLHERFGIDHVTLQPELRGSAQPHTAVVRLWPQRKRPGT